LEIARGNFIGKHKTVRLLMSVRNSLLCPYRVQYSLVKIQADVSDKITLGPGSN